MKDLHAEIDNNVKQALAEDIGAGDLTALLTPVWKELVANVHSREDAVLCGAQWVTSGTTLLISVKPFLTSNVAFHKVHRVKK